MRYIVIIALLSLSMLSCSSFKKVSKTDSSKDSTAETSAQESLNTVSKIDTKSTKTITIEVDTNLIVKSDTLNGKTTLKDISKGSFVLSNKDIITMLDMDIDGSINITSTTVPKVIPVKIKKTISETEDRKEEKIIRSDSSGTSKVVNNEKINVTDKIYQKSWFSWWWVLIIVILILVYLGRSYIRKFLPF